MPRVSGTRRGAAPLTVAHASCAAHVSTVVVWQSAPADLSQSMAVFLPAFKPRSVPFTASRVTMHTTVSMAAAAPAAPS